MEVTSGYFEANILTVCDMAQEEPVSISDAGKTIAIVLSVDDYMALVIQASGSGSGSANTTYDVDPAP